MTISLLLVTLGVVLLFVGGDTLVGGATALARQLGMSPLVVGLTVVAFATSCPELAATFTAALRGSPDMALGNVVGSNIANVALILGASALIAPLAASARFLRREVAFMLLVTVVIYPLLRDGILGRVNAVFLLAALVFFLVTLLRDPASAHVETDDDEPPGPRQQGMWPAFFVVLGLLMLIGGAQALVRGASDIAVAFGVPERVIGLTLLALGTSLPELATSIAAARKGQSDIILGNVIGSNIFNLLCILGLTALVQPIAVAPAVLQVDYWVMFATSALIIVLLAMRKSIVHWEGALLLTAYAAYMIFLFQGSAG